MPSPFPGMNPFLEQPDTWEDFHQSFITHTRDSLSGMVGSNYLIKIDLRRGGTRPSPPDLPNCDYYALVSRCNERPRVGVWPLRLRDRLPVIPVPRTPPDPDVPLDLQALLHRVYDAADYGKYIYRE